MIQDDWDNPVYSEWAKCLTAHVEQCQKPAIFIVHSLGTSLASRWSLEFDSGKVAGAFLVAPSDRDSAKALANDAIKGFAPMKLATLPFPSMVISSSDDPHVSPERAGHFVNAWGARFVNIGPLGHIGANEKLGLWPEGLILLGSFIESLAKKPQA